MAAFTPAGVELVVKGAGQFFGTLDKAAGKVGSFGATIGKAAVAGVAALGAAVVGVGAVSLKAAIDFESAFTGVIKTTDGLVDEFGNLTQAGTEIQQGFRDLAKEVPTSVEELLRIGELGGQLGIGREGLVDFTRTIAAMGEATNLTTEEAATGFAQIANIMQTPQNQIENMGSSIVALGNNFATTERDVLTFAQRIAGAGQIAGLTESDVFGIGAAMSSVGVQAEAGGTAVQKVLLAMNKAAIEGGEQMDIFSAVAGLSAEDFGTAWQEDAGAVFGEFVKGLGLAGDDAINILGDLGLEDQRLIRSFLSLAGAGDLLTDAMDLSTDAFAENTALTKEAEARYRTTASQFGILKNQLKDVAITIGQALLPFLNKLLKAAMPLIEEFGKRLPDVMDKVTGIIQGVAGAVGLLFRQFKGLGLKDFFSTFEDGSTTIGGFLKRLGIGEKVAEGVGQAINKVARFLMKVTNFIIKNQKAIVGAFKAIGIAIAVAFAAQKIMGIVKLITMLTNPIGIIIAVVGLLGAAWAGNWGGIQEKTAAVINFLRPAFEQIWQFLGIIIPSAIQFLSSLWTNTLLPAFQAFADFLVGTLGPVVQEIAAFVVEQFQKAVAWVVENWPLIQETVQTVLNFVSGIVQTVLNFVSGIVQTVLGAILGFWDTHGTEIMTLVSTVWETIKTVIDTVMGTIQSIISAVMLIINGDWETALGLLQIAAETIWLAIQMAIDTAMAVIKFIIDTGMQLIQSVWETIWNTIKTTAETIWNTIKTFINERIKDIRTIIGFIMGKIRDKIKEIWEDVKTKISDTWDDIKTLVSDKLNDVLDLIKDTASDFLAAGQAIVDKIREGIENAWQGLVDWFKGKLKGLTDLLPWNSPPKDPASPLRQLQRAGVGFVDEIMKGIAQQMPALQAQLTTGLMPQQTMAPLAGGAGGGVTNNVNVNMGPTTIASGMDQLVFEERVRTVVRDAIGET